MRILQVLALKQDWITGVGVEFTYTALAGKGAGRPAGTACVET
jgi:hypothetical protein